MYSDSNTELEVIIRHEQDIQQVERPVVYHVIVKQFGVTVADCKFAEHADMIDLLAYYGA